jgi:hypothetical protein
MTLSVFASPGLASLAALAAQAAGLQVSVPSINAAAVTILSSPPMVSGDSDAAVGSYADTIGAALKDIATASDALKAATAAFTAAQAASNPPPSAISLVAPSPIPTLAVGTAYELDLTIAGSAVGDVSVTIANEPPGLVAAVTGGSVVKITGTPTGAPPGVATVTVTDSAAPPNIASIAITFPV